MRLAITLSLFAGPAAAWTFAATPVCTLTGPNTVVTFDASRPEYSIRIDTPAGWRGGDVFSITYSGARPLTISTNRHEIDGTTLIVRDRGFGNVLNGMHFNDSFTARLGDQDVTVSLDGIDPAMTDFKACPAPATS